MPTFTPPVTYDVPRVLPSTRGNAYWVGRLLSPIPRGRTVLKAADGSYSIVDTPTVDEMAAAAIVYQGGHIYTVSNAEAAALVAAGFTVT